MTTASIDIDTLDNLFENQQKLDDVFNSIFDDDFFGAPLTISDEVIDTKQYKTESKENLYYSEDNYIPAKRSVAYMVLPVVLEIAAIYYGVIYLF